MTGVLIDNDVLIKVAAYRLGDELVSIASIGGEPPLVLGVAKFVVRDGINRKGRLADPEQARNHFDEFLPNLRSIEPTGDELSLAADLEGTAQQAGLPLDVGESQLLAVLASRPADLLLTGDKRAIVAIGELAVAGTAEKLACFEQLLLTIIAATGAPTVCAAVCGEPKADITAALCCGCASGRHPDAPGLVGALKSYIGDLRSKAAGALIAADDLAALAA